MELEGPLLRVPFEALKAAARTRARLAAELAEVAALQGTRADDLADVHQRLLTLKRKFGHVSAEEAAALQHLRARAQHLTAAVGADPDALRAWEGVRLDRLLAEHLLRSGQHASGAALAAAAGVGELVDAELHGANAAVAAALRGGDSQQALAWCELHRAKLKKLRSTLEFRLRLQQFVELVRSGRQRDAVAHARLHVAPLAAGSNLRELQRAMALLVLKPQAPPRCSRHAALLSPAAWEALAEEFSADSARVHGLTRVPGVELRLQAGLCALNTPHAQRGERGGASARNDPLASALFARLAAGLPHTKHVHSRLVCPITQLVMNEDNPPAALPNGYVYSRAALEALAAASGGRLFCPRTGAGPFDVALLQKVFLA